MSAKQGPLNQHNVLHQHFPGDCCLCRTESEIATLKTKCEDLTDCCSTRDYCIQEQRKELTELREQLKTNQVMLALKSAPKRMTVSEVLEFANDLVIKAGYEGDEVSWTHALDNNPFYEHLAIALHNKIWGDKEKNE